MNGIAFGELTIIVLVVLLGVPALLVVVAAMLPGYLERSRGVFRAHPGRSFLLGLLNVLVLLGLTWLCILVQLPLFQGVGMFLFVIVLPVCATLGVLVAAGLVGETVWQQLAGRPINHLAAVILGSLILVLVLLVPVVGWLLVPVLAIIGLGAAITALARRGNSPPVEGSPTGARM